MTRLTPRRRVAARSQRIKEFVITTVLAVLVAFAFGAALYKAIAP